MNYWLAKTEPEEYGYGDLVRKGRDRWNGVRNPVAQKNIRAMKPGDQVFIYHTGKEKSIVGVAEVVSESYPEVEEPRFATVDLEPRYSLSRTVALKEIKANPGFEGWELVRLPRLSVMPVTHEHWKYIHQLSGTPSCVVC
jgi:predicted RNA-binding protein with PUA-like domain